MDLSSLDGALLNLFDIMPFGASFLAGILTFLSPCILPLIPPYISYISGLSVSEIQSHASAHHRRIIFSSLLFIAGFCLVFITLGIFAGSSLGALFASLWVRYLFGGLIIAFGIHFLLPQRFKLLSRTLELRFNHTRFGLLAPFFLGIGFSIGWSPCVGPILASILALSLAHTGDALYLMLSYCAGLGLSFLLVAIFVNRALLFLKNLRPFLKVVEILSGLLLLLIGVLIIFNKTDFFIS